MNSNLSLSKDRLEMVAVSKDLIGMYGEIVNLILSDDSLTSSQRKGILSNLRHEFGHAIAASNHSDNVFVSLRSYNWFVIRHSNRYMCYDISTLVVEIEGEDIHYKDINDGYSKGESMTYIDVDNREQIVDYIKDVVQGGLDATLKHFTEPDMFSLGNLKKWLEVFPYSPTRWMVSFFKGSDQYHLRQIKDNNTQGAIDLNEDIKSINTSSRLSQSEIKPISFHREVIDAISSS